MGQKICRYCGKVINKDAQNCEYCGKYVLKKPDGSGLFCSQCQATVNEDDNFCQFCGAIFNIVPINDEPEDDVIKHNINGIRYNIVILLTSLAASITLTFFNTAGKNAPLGQSLIFFSIAFIITEISLYIYFLPSILAIENNKKNMYIVYICNLLLGITVIGWFVAFGMALSSEQKK